MHRTTNCLAKLDRMNKTLRQPDRVPVDLGATPSSGTSTIAYYRFCAFTNATVLCDGRTQSVAAITQQRPTGMCACLSA